jgi:subtilisin-like proprotein convertase family protein
MKKELSRKVSTRHLAAIAILLLAGAVMAQPMTSIWAKLAPRVVSSADRPVDTTSSTHAGSQDRSLQEKGGPRSQNRAEAIQATFTNNTVVTIPATNVNLPSQPATPYPSTISVAGQTGSVTAVTVKLNSFHHTQQKDVDMLLVGPNGGKFIFMSDIGGSGPGTVIDLTFDDTAASVAPATTISATSTFKPTNQDQPATGADVFVSPAPAAPYSMAAPVGSDTFASVFAGGTPNGNWSLYVMDDAGADSGALDGGWTLGLTTSVAAAPTTTTLMSSLNPSLTTQMVSFTAHVAKTSDNSNVTVGTVTFVDNSTSTVLASNVALNASGNASTPNVSLVERRHLITATYNPDPAFITSSGQLFQTVDFPTTNPTPGMYCNTNSVTIPDPAGGGATSGPAVQFPSHITVSGLGGRITHMTVSLKNVSDTAAQDMDILLVGPGGQNLVIVSDAGGATTNVSLDIDDNAAGQLAAGGAWGGSGTTVQTRPVDYLTGDTFPSPAPAGPYNEPAPAATATLSSIFNNSSPNGVWSLYILDDAGGDVGTMAGGWCLTITTANSAPVDFDGDGISDYAVVRDSGLPRPGPLDSGTMDQVTSGSTAGATGQMDEGMSLNSGRGISGGQRGTYFRLPGERFDPLAPRIERTNQIEANQLRWLIHTSGPTADLNILFGTLADFPVPADYDGDGKCDVAVWTGGAGAQFKVLTSSSGFLTMVTYTLGSSSSDPSVVGDYDGDGKADPAIMNANTGQWSYLGGPTHSVLTTVTPVGTFGGGFPAPGDYDGDGKYDFMLETRDGINPTMGHFYQWLNTGSTTPPATTNFTFGNYSDVIVPQDYDGDGKADVGRATVITNPIQWRIRITPAGTLLGPFNLGNPALDYTLEGDYDGGGKGDLTIWHAPGQFQSLLAPTYTTPTTDFSWGQAGDYPVAYFNSH